MNRPHFHPVPMLCLCLLPLLNGCDSPSSPAGTGRKTYVKTSDPYGFF